MVADVLDIVEHQNCVCVAVYLEACSDNLTELLLSAEEVNFQSVWILLSINKTEILWESLVEDEAANCRLYELSRVLIVQLATYLDLGMDTNNDS